MNSDIRISVCFPAHTKTKKLKRILGSDGVLSLITLWTYAAQNRPDGALTGMDLDDIAIASDWSGDEKEFIDALVKIGWVEKIDGVYILHDWEENNPWAADAVNRSERARKAAEKRWERAKEQSENDSKEMPEDANSNADSMQDALPVAQSSNAPFLSLPNLTLPKEGEEEICELRKLHLNTCGLNSLPPIALFRSLLKKGTTIEKIIDVYQLHGGDIQKYRQRNIVEKLEAIRDGTTIDHSGPTFTELYGGCV